MTRNDIQAKVNDLTIQLANTPRNAGQKRKDLEFTLNYWKGQLAKTPAVKRSQSPEPKK